MCFGDSLLLDAGAGFNAYLWNDGTSGQTTYANAVGNYTVTVTDGNGCQDFDDIEILMYPQIPDPSIIQIGNTLQSSSPTGNQWYSVTTGLIPGATGATYDPLTEDSYYVIITDANGCQSIPSPDFVFIIDGVEQVNGVKFTLAPNPANDHIEIKFTGATNGKTKVEILNLHGQIVFSEVFEHLSKETIDISSFNQGIYFVRLTSGNKSNNRKLVISR